MRLVSVFDSDDLPDEDMRDMICDEQGNDSFRCVYLDAGEWRWDSENQRHTEPLDTLARIAQWAKDQGAHVAKDCRYPYVLFSISW